jgi:hypothetical protein
MHSEDSAQVETGHAMQVQGFGAASKLQQCRLFGLFAQSALDWHSRLHGAGMPVQLRSPEHSGSAAPGKIVLSLSLQSGPCECVPSGKLNWPIQPSLSPSVTLIMSIITAAEPFMGTVTSVQPAAST